MHRVTKLLHPYQSINNVKIYNLRSNVGPSLARKYGFKKSKGKYIYFLDAEDKIYIEKILNVIKDNNGIDIITFNHKSMSNNKIRKTKANSCADIIKWYAGIYLRVFKKTLISSDDFINEKWYADDVYTTINLSKKAKTFKKVDEVIFVYNDISLGGLSSQVNLSNWLTMLNTMDALIYKWNNDPLIVSRKLFQSLAYLYRMKKFKNKKIVYQKLFSAIRKTKGFWKLKFKVKLFYIFVRLHLYWFMYIWNKK